MNNLPSTSELAKKSAHRFLHDINNQCLSEIIQSALDEQLETLGVKELLATLEVYLDHPSLDGAQPTRHEYRKALKRFVEIWRANETRHTGVLWCNGCSTERVADATKLCDKCRSALAKL